jgi:WD40-like Beta Propeller Repeat
MRTAGAIRAVGRMLCLAWAIAGAGLAIPSNAAADLFGPISLVSEGTLPEGAQMQQVDYAHDSAISANGQYVAFDGAFGDVSGVWRRDLATSAIEPVAVGEAGTPAGSAELPSISANGRYVSFTTTAQLVPGDTNQGPDVYVRDMEPGSGEPTYILASAVSGSEQALSYETSTPQSYGSVASGRSAMSADGNYVAFVTTAVSNLSGPHTPAFQVAVRDLARKETKLVSVATGSEDEPVPTKGEGTSTIGAVYGANKPFPPPVGGPAAQGASISADGSTVAWMAQEIEKQAPVLREEANLNPEYTEPLWRKIGPDGAEPTRRTTGGGDPADPECAASGEAKPAQPPTLSDVCQGPFDTRSESGGTGIWTLGAQGEDYLPRLSENGQMVAFIASAREIASGEELKVAQSSDDLYVVNMADGLTRVHALRRLTEIASESAAGSARIDDLAVSPDGTQVAFSSERTLFGLGSLADVSPPVGEVGMDELYDVDLANDTLTRVTRGVEGGPSEQPHRPVQAGIDPYPASDGAFSPSFSADGDALAFSSTASNLVYDDGNSPPLEDPNHAEDGSDAFVVSRLSFSSVTPQQSISPPPEGPKIEPYWQLSVTARPQRDGSVLLDVTAPGAGSLRAAASAAVLVSTARTSRAARRGHATARRGHAAAHRDRAAAHENEQTVATRTVASTVTGTPPGAGSVTALVLELGSDYSALAGARGGLSAIVTVTLAAPGHPTIEHTMPVTFVRSVQPARARRASVKRSARR